MPTINHAWPTEWKFIGYPTLYIPVMRPSTSNKLKFRTEKRSTTLGNGMKCTVVGLFLQTHQTMHFVFDT
jgi:hypothetical protein